MSFYRSTWALGTGVAMLRALIEDAAGAALLVLRDICFAWKRSSLRYSSRQAANVTSSPASVTPAQSRPLGGGGAEQGAGALADDASIPAASANFSTAAPVPTEPGYDTTPAPAHASAQPPLLFAFPVLDPQRPRSQGTVELLRREGKVFCQLFGGLTDPDFERYTVLLRLHGSKVSPRIHQLRDEAAFLAALRSAGIPYSNRQPGRMTDHESAVWLILWSAAVQDQTGRLVVTTPRAVLAAILNHQTRILRKHLRALERKGFVVRQGEARIFLHPDGKGVPLPARPRRIGRSSQGGSVDPPKEDRSILPISSLGQSSEDLFSRTPFPTPDPVANPPPPAAAAANRSSPTPRASSTDALNLLPERAVTTAASDGSSPASVPRPSALETDASPAPMASLPLAKDFTEDHAVSPLVTPRPSARGADGSPPPAVSSSFASILSQELAPSQASPDGSSPAPLAAPSSSASELGSGRADSLVPLGPRPSAFGPRSSHVRGPGSPGIDIAPMLWPVIRTQLLERSGDRFKAVRPWLALFRCLAARDGVLTLGVLVPATAKAEKRQKVLSECQRHEAALLELAALRSPGAWQAAWVEINMPPLERQDVGHVVAA